MNSLLVDDGPKQLVGQRGAAVEVDDGLTIRNGLMPLASLKFTVTLFAMTIVLVFAGTLAQVEKDIWQVIDEYFRTLITWIDFQLFFPPSFFPDPPQVSGGFYFPGGWLLGTLLMVNLVAAHSVRFKVYARGRRLLAGLAAITTGALLTASIVVAGASHDGLNQVAWFGWSAVWGLFQVGLAIACGAMLYGGWRMQPSRQTERWFLFSGAGSLAAVLIWTLFRGEAGRLDDSSLRILWQLGKGTLAGLVLLVGCLLVFQKRAGIVLIHAGIGMMMCGELLVGLTAVESRMRIREGETVNFVYDIRNLELAVIDKSQPGRHEVVSVPESLLRGARIIRHEHLPFDIQVVQFVENARVQAAGPNMPNLATAGIGRQWIAESIRPVSGTDTSGAINQSAAYLRLLDKHSAADLGTHLVGLVLTSAELPDKVEADGKTYHLYLRFKRTYKPYSLTLLDVRKDDYPGTDTPRNYSSDVRLVESGRNVDRETKIWMNNPLRFSGETFYQSGYFRDPETGFESTTLSVVRNSSWMLPYVACMIVATGLLAHFGAALMRFLKRRSGEQRSSTETVREQSAATVAATRWGNRLEWILPALIVVVLAGWIGSKARAPRHPAGEMQLYEFGKLPVVDQGRLKPLDALARDSLQIISDRQTFVDERGDRQSAIRWLLDLIARPGESDTHRTFRVEHPEVLDAMGLPRRKGLRYSFAELEPRLNELHKQAALARTMDPGGLSVYQKKIIALDNKLALRDLLVQSFTVPNTGQTEQPIDFVAVLQQQQALARRQPPLCIPPIEGNGPWQAYSTAWAQDQLQSPVASQSAHPATTAMTAMFAAYQAGDAARFNGELQSFQAQLDTEPPADLNLSKISFEAFFNHFAPFYHASALYVIAFVLVALSWLGWSGPLNRAAFWLILLTLGIHTFALLSRIYISGRPPVTNLYSSAVFIGWGCVVLGAVLERIYRIGIGNVVCSITGFVTLVIAHFLAGDGDTFAVLQAVLDTQFWLATHVVCITLGYTTTFVAGLLGVIYVLRGVLTPSLSAETGRQICRMIYGTLCFATLFSFVGTVLGGLWADDSWGRFWGWDPKENGALIIVLWNALVLHARWGGFIRQRGLAVLAVGGNIAVGWSWFDVNELGVGLHSYGFTEGVLQTLGIFVISQLAIIGLGLLPERCWWSLRRQEMHALPR